MSSFFLKFFPAVVQTPPAIQRPYIPQAAARRQPPMRRTNKKADLSHLAKPR